MDDAIRLARALPQDIKVRERAEQRRDARSGQLLPLLLRAYQAYDRVARIDKLAGDRRSDPAGRARQEHAHSSLVGHVRRRASAGW